MNEAGTRNSEKIGLFQIVVLILSIIVLCALGADTVFKLPKEISDILQTLDTLVCVLLLTDFGIRFYKAESKLAFLKWGWIDLIASIPNVPLLRVGRLIRILRVIRLLRAIRATQKISSVLLKNRLHTGITSVVLSSFLLVTFCSIGILISTTMDGASITLGGASIPIDVSSMPVGGPSITIDEASINLGEASITIDEPAIPVGGASITIGGASLVIDGASITLDGASMVMVMA